MEKYKKKSDCFNYFTIDFELNKTEFRLIKNQWERDKYNLISVDLT